MKHTAIQFLQAKLEDKSQVFLFAGKNRWLKRQIKEKIQDIFGKSQNISYQDEESLRNIADTVSMIPITGGQKQFIHFMSVPVDNLDSWLNYLELPEKGTLLLIEVEHKKDDARSVQSLIKLLSKFDNKPAISYIDLRDPPEQACLQIISMILAGHNISDKKEINNFYAIYGADFDACEQNAGSAIKEKKAFAIQDLWSLAQHWLERKQSQTLLDIDNADRSDFNTFAIHNQLVSQIRQHILAKASGRGHPAVVNRAISMSDDWLTQVMTAISELNPISSTYMDELRIRIISTFIG